MIRSATTDRIADTLSRGGSLWFESAFCNGLEAGGLLFSNPIEVIQLTSLSGLKNFFETLQEKHAQGYYLAGWLSYEAGYGFEHTLFAADTVPQSSVPLAWFGVYNTPDRLSPKAVTELFSDNESPSLESVSFNLTQNEYAHTIRILKDDIAAGNVYQVNFTGRYRFTLTSSAQSLFRTLRSAQPHSYRAFLKTGTRTILSFSPELFFKTNGSHIETMPMKGTAARGSTPEQDNQLKESLSQCQKNLAENLMIVDLLRNDLGRICKSGSVSTKGLFVTETYPTLHQMVSTIHGEQRENIRLYDLFKALYPCGSITGAPKIKAMSRIQTLEAEPRGIYTGAIGFINPDRTMVFNVAIRTIELSGNKGTYGTGSGIVWDSDPQNEYQECLLKAKILTDIATPTFNLFESILWTGHYHWLQEHLDRLASSAQVLKFPYQKAAAMQLLTGLEATLHQRGTRFKIRLTLSLQGTFTADYDPIEVQHLLTPVRLCLAAENTDSTDPLLCHKTTSRKLYDSYYQAARKKGYDEVIFQNERNEVTEGAISNVIIRKGSHFYTPELSSGLLNGIYRQYFLTTRPTAREKTLTLQDLLTADALYIANSVRGIRQAIFTKKTIQVDQ